MKHLAWLILSLGLAGCAALPGLFDTIFGQSREKAVRTPLWVYRADLRLWSYDGVGVVAAADKYDIHVESQIRLDRIEVETCARQDVCQNDKHCPPSFEVESGWWGNPGKRMVYHFIPSAIEAEGSCPIFIKVFDKAALAAWGFLAVRKDETLSGLFVCNGQSVLYPGHSVCQTKAGLIQRLSFEIPIEDFEVDRQCGLKKIDEKNFELRPELGLCTGKFYADKRWHGIDIIAYDEVLIRQ